MKRRRPLLSTQSGAILALTVIEMCGLVAVIFVGWQVRNRPDLLVEILGGYMNTILLSTISGLLGYLRGDSDLPAQNALRLSELERSYYPSRQSNRQGYDTVPEPEAAGITQETQVRRRVTYTPPTSVNSHIPAPISEDDPP